MMQRCKRCHSWAINEKMHGRIEGTDSDLCDVCYWRARAEGASKDEVIAKILAAYKEHYSFPPQGESHMTDVLDEAIAPNVEPKGGLADGRMHTTGRKT